MRIFTPIAVSVATLARRGARRSGRPGASVTITTKKGGAITGRVTDAEDRAAVAVSAGLE